MTKKTKAPTLRGTAQLRAPGNKRYVAVVWYEDAGHRFFKKSVVIEAESALAVPIQATDALDMDPYTVAGFEVQEIRT